MSSAGSTRMRTLVPVLGVLGGLLLIGAPDARAQGCVAARLDAPSGTVNTKGESYFLAAGRWQASFGYQYFHSHRHFVGAVEQDGSPGTRDRRTTPVENWINIPELTLQYGLSDRLSIAADVPILVARRQIPGTVFKEFRGIDGAPDQVTHARGIGDINLIGRYWVGRPDPRGRQNLSIGLGIKLPTGKDNVQDSVSTIAATGAPPQTAAKSVDQSIQPGDGGLGLIGEVQAFKAVGRVSLFATASYLSNPRGTNGVPTGRGRETEAVMSVADQYGARVGAGIALPFHPALAVSLAARLEGVPVHDLFGSSEGFRRPGYSVGIEPGLSYSWSHTAISLSVPWLVRRVRPQSVPDLEDSDATGRLVEGDAAFADYLILLGVSRRF